MPIKAQLISPFLARPTPRSDVPLLLPVAAQPQRLLLLEQRIAAPDPAGDHQQLLNDYLDMALDEADAAGQKRLLPLQESWLTRSYLTLRQAALNPATPLAWRRQCFDYLYQPFFALQHLYLGRPDQQRKLRGLVHEFRTLGRLFTS